MGGEHKDPWVQCDFCDQAAVYHWRDTYPDLLLCARCLKDYPEAQEPGGTEAHLRTDQNAGSGTSPPC
jgi:hypothetical protein